MFWLRRSELRRGFQRANKMKSGDETYSNIVKQLQLENMSIFLFKFKHFVACEERMLMTNEDRLKSDAHGWPVVVVAAISLIVKIDHS